MALLDSVPGARTTQRFGPAVSSVAYLEPAMWVSGDKAYWVQFPGSKFVSHFHPGVDHAAVTGTIIRAIESGTVVFSGWRSSTSGYAIEVEIRPGVRYGFNHCSSKPTAIGKKVARGAAIATIGSTGVTTGPHTHAFVSIKEAGTDGIVRTFIYNPAVFEAGGRLASDSRIKPLGTPAPAPTPPPATSVPGTISFAKGTYVGHQFNATGAITATKPYTLSKSSSAYSSQRSLIKNQTGFWYYITNGIWAGFWIRESAGITVAGSVPTPTPPAPPSSGKLVFLKGPSINIRTTPDLDVGTANLYATSHKKGVDGWTLDTGIWRQGKRIHANIGTGFGYRRDVTTDDGVWVEVLGFSRTLYIFKSLVTIQ